MISAFFTPKKAGVAKGSGGQPKAILESSAQGSPISAAASSAVAGPARLAICQLEPVDSVNALHLAEVQLAMDAILAPRPQVTAKRLRRTYFHIVLRLLPCQWACVAMA